MTRKEAISTIESESCYECSWGCESPTKCNCPKCDLKSAIKLAIEALKDRPHGEWIPTDEIGSVVRCSRCSFRTCADVAEEEYNFCPNCGADMRKEGEEQ